jgi:S-DNA-T family DNA segregation ATPase FtsK/SpoIIIE
MVLTGAGLVVAALLILAALATYQPSDPSLNTAAAGPVLNWLAAPGAYAADFLLSLLGPPIALLAPLVVVLGLRVARGAWPGRWGRALAWSLLGIFLIGTASALLIGGAVNGLPAGWGGALGLSFARLIDLGIAGIGDDRFGAPLRIAAMALAALSGAFVWYLGLGLRRDERRWLSQGRARGPRLIGDRPLEDRRGDGRRILGEEDEDQAPRERPARTPIISRPEPPRTVIAERVRITEKSERPNRERQTSLALGDTYKLPTLDLLNPPPPPSNTTLDRASLERNARLLESVLEDFSVKGEIVEVRPGPVVTMYEL